MKKLLTLAALVGFSTLTYSQGQMYWQNTASTLISDAAVGGPMPFRVSLATTYYFGLFIAPYGTPEPLPGMAGVNDLNWQNVVAYTMNSSSPAGVGRMANPGVATNVPLGITFSFIIRGWQSYSGGADWEAAKSSLYNYGQSDLGFATFQGDAFPTPFAFGVGDSPYGRQVGGFVIGVPEPSSMALFGVGVAACVIARRRNRK